MFGLYVNGTARAGVVLGREDRIEWTSDSRIETDPQAKEMAASILFWPILELTACMQHGIVV